MLLPKIYPITDAGLTKISHAEQVKKLIEGGAELIQLREKNASPIEFFESAKMALEIAREHNVKIIINDRVDIALTLKADGVHLGQDDLPPEKAREILGKRAIIGFSTHNLKQAFEATKKPINYIAIGPVFATKTKKNPDEVVGINGLKQIRKKIGEFPLVAIGGINYENYLEVLEAGADSVAIISGILSDSENITQTFENYNHKQLLLKNLKHG
ncbi:MAG: thiamine phosphate synthase [Aridibacter sp.]